MRICTIFTGGTIGSVVNQSGYIGPIEGSPFRLLQLYREQFGNEIDFIPMEPYRILSENVTADNLLLLIKAVNEALLQKDIQGVVVTHGTDTLQYSSAILGYLFGNSDIPIVIVSSNYVLYDSRANGLTNFYYAIEFIRGNYGKGVFVSYCNENEFPTIHRATRLQPAVPCSDYVSSVCDSWYGRFECEEYVSNSAFRTIDGMYAMFENVETVKLNEESRQIMRFNPYVGMYYPEVQSKTKVVLHGSYHSGTICIDDKLKAFAMKIKDMGIPFYLTGLVTGMQAYETVQGYQELGIIPLQTSGEVAQYCKLWLALSNGLDISSVMNTSIAEDWII